MYDMNEALALIRKYSEDHVPLRTRLWRRLKVFCRALIPVMAGLWVISTSTGSRNDGLIITIPGDTEVSVQFMNANGAMVELYPEDGTFSRGEYIYHYYGLIPGEAYLVRLYDLEGGIIDRARIIADSDTLIELHYITITDWWQESRSGVA